MDDIFTVIKRYFRGPISTIVVVAVVILAYYLAVN